MEELKSFSPVVAGKPMLLVASRIDAGSGERLTALREFCRTSSMVLIEISSVTGEGLEQLKRQSWAMLEQIPRHSQAPIAASDREIG